MYEHLYSAFKAGLLVYLLYALYKWVLKVYYLKRHFAKYPNVVVNPNAHFLFGDYITEDGEEDDEEIQYFIDTIMEKPHTDIIVEFDYRTPAVYLCSPRAIKEFKAQFPDKIDR